MKQEEKMETVFLRAFVSLFGFMFLFQGFFSAGIPQLIALGMSGILFGYGCLPRKWMHQKSRTLENVAKR